MSKVKTVAFASIGPDAIEIFMSSRGYRVVIFRGKESKLEERLRRDATHKNVVLLPHFAKRDLLEPYAK